MTISINTSDALAASLTYLFGVDTDNVIKEFKAGLALTPHANVKTPASSIPSTSAPYGRSFRTGGSVNPGSGAVTTEGVDFTAVPVPNTGPVSVFVVTNQFNSASGAGTNVSGQLFGIDTAGKKAGAGIVYDAVTGKFSPSNFQSGVATASSLHTAGVINTGARSFGFTRNNLSPVFAYINGVLDSSFSGGAANNNGQFGYNYADSEFGYIGGMPTYSYISMDYVYIAVFVGVQLTASDFSRLHASLTGGGNFALVSGAVPAFALSGSITTSNVGNASFTADWPAATGGNAPITYDYSTNGGSTWTNWPTNTRNLSGLTPGALINFKVRAVDSTAALTSVLSASVQLSSSPDSPPAFTVSPSSGSYSAGATPTLSWTATGTPVPTIQLQRSINSGTSWTDIASSGSTFAVPALSSGDNGVQYRVRAQNSIASTVQTAYSSVATLTVVSPATALLVTGSSAGQTGVASGTITITANGSLGASKTVVGSDGAGGTVTFAGGTTLVNAGSVTATYTPSSAGAKTVTFTVSDASLTAAALSYTSNTNPGTVTVPGLSAWTGTAQASLTVPNVVVVQRSNRAVVLALINQTTDGSGNLAITAGALSAGVGYMVLGFTDDGSSSFRRAVTGT